MAFCSKCGLVVGSEISLCSNCGSNIVVSKLSNEESSYVSVEPPMGRNFLNIFFIVFASIVVLVIILYALAFFTLAPNYSSIKISFNERSALGFLMQLSSEQESFHEKNPLHTYGKLKEILDKNKLMLPEEKLGFTFYDLITEPDANFYAVVAAPIEWGKTGRCYYIVTSTGVVRSSKDSYLDFKVSNKGDQKLIDTINRLKEAR